MRESIGGTMLFWIVLFFMTIFIAFMAAIIHYARVYKIKNSMINYIERSEGIKTQAEFESVLLDLGYPAQKDGYIICRRITGDTGGYYSLSLFANFDMPFAKQLIRVEIKGETRQIETGTLIKDSGDTGGSWFTGDVSRRCTCFPESAQASICNNE